MELNYEAADQKGEVLKGELQADSPLEALRQLSSKDLTVIELKENLSVNSTRFQRKLSRQDLLMAMHELATLLESGVSLAEAVTAQSKGSYHPALSLAFQSTASSLMKGENLLSALRATSLDLPEYFFQLIAAGETSGHLAESLRQGVEQMEYDLKVLNEMRSALIYPLVLVFSGIAAVLLVFVFVVPKFANLLDNNPDLPLLAEIVLRSGVWFNANSWLFLGASIAFTLAMVSLLRQAAVRDQILNALSQFPVLKGWFTETDTAQWASMMSAMLTSRVELMQALELAQKSVKISRRRSKLETVNQDVRGGISLAEALEKQAALTPTGYNLIRVGEQTGELAPVLRSLSKLYDESSRTRMKQVLTLIEPLAILLIGAVIGVIILGIILAITSVNDVGL